MCPSGKAAAYYSTAEAEGSRSGLKLFKVQMKLFNSIKKAEFTLSSKGHSYI